MRTFLAWLWADITRKVAPNSKVAYRAWSEATRRAGEWEA